MEIKGLFSSKLKSSKISLFFADFLIKSIFLSSFKASPLSGGDCRPVTAADQPEFRGPSFSNSSHALMWYMTEYGCG
jgi:hypothetical protein